MAHPVKKIYKDGSPGANRKAQALTLTALKRKIKGNSYQRKNHNEQGLLGWRAF